MTQGNNTTESYSYDPVGNRTASLAIPSYTVNSSNERTSDSSASYTYDNNGNSLTKVVGSNTTSYSWDFENRLTSVTLPNGGGTVQFKYDPFGRRIEKVSPTTTSIFVYDGPDLVETMNSSRSQVARYSQGPGIDQPLAMERGGTTDYYEQDRLGSVTSLSAANGSVAQTYTYDSFGNTTSSTGSLTNFFRYTARELDTETGLYYYRARYYDPAAGRFLGEDPLEFEGGTNFYDYVANDPTALFDPFGLKASKCATKNCIQRALEALFPGITSSVGDPTGNPNPNGGHWNFAVQLTFPSLDTANSFWSNYVSQGQAGFGPYTRYASGNKGGIGTTLHLELGKSPNEIVNPNGNTTLMGKAHLDSYDPNTGLAGMAGHGIIDGLVGHIADLLRSNIDPANCPW